MSQNVSFDNTNPALRYEGIWFHLGNYPPSEGLPGGSLSSSSDTHANITFKFPVPARAFYYWGMQRCCGGMYAICADCNPNDPQEFAAIDAVNSSAGVFSRPMVLWSKRWDTPGTHTIILMNQKDGRAGKDHLAQITLDRFEIEIINDDTETSFTGGSTFSAISSSSSSIPLPRTSIAVSWSSAASTPSPGSVPAGSDSQATNGVRIGPIVGASVGGAIALILLMIAVGCFLSRRDRKRRNPAIADPAPSELGPIATESSAVSQVKPRSWQETLKQPGYINWGSSRWPRSSIATDASQYPGAEGNAIPDSGISKGQRWSAVLRPFERHTDRDPVKSGGQTLSVSYGTGAEANEEERQISPLSP